MSQRKKLRSHWQNLWASASHMTAGGNWSLQLAELTQRNLRNFFFDGLFSAASDSFILTYLTLFVLALGASTAEIGWMTALASLSATLLLIPGAKMTDRTVNRKRIVITFAGIMSRLPLILMATIPLIFKGPTAIWVAIVLKVVIDAARNLALPAWTSITADIVPLAWRGRYFATRNVAMGVATMVVTYGIGEFITQIGDPQGYQWALILAFVLGLSSTWYFSRLQEPKENRNQTALQNYKFRGLVSTLQTDKNFLTFWIYTAIWTFSLNIAGPFFNVFLVRDLKTTASLIGIIAVVGKIAALPSQRIFGLLADRWGPRKLMWLTTIMIPLLPISWYFVQASWQAIPINIVGGVLWAGYNLASFNMLLEIAPADQRARYSALYQIAITISTAAGAALGGVIAETWGIRLAFLASGIGRTLAAGLFTMKVQQPASETAMAATEG